MFQIKFLFAWIKTKSDRVCHIFVVINVSQWDTPYPGIAPTKCHNQSKCKTIALKTNMLTYGFPYILLDSNKITKQT